MRLLPGKIPVRINIFFLIVVGLIGWLNSSTPVQAVIWMAVIFVSVLLHEFGHALTAIAFGQSVDIELTGFGGMTRRSGPPIKLWQEFLIVLNGPLVGFLLFLAAYQVLILLGGQKMSLFIYALDIIVYINLFWTLLNLIPVYPLDGGHLLRIVLEAIFGLRGLKIALFISMATAAAIGVWFFKIGILIIGALFFILAFESFRSWQSAMALTDQDRNTGMQERLKEAENAMQKGREIEALRLLKGILNDSKMGIIFIAASECSAKILFDQGQFKEAYELLNPVRKKISQEGLALLQNIAFKLEDWKDAISLGNEVYQNQPNYETALLNALCHSILGHTQPAVGWLRTAIEQGLPDPPHVLLRREFDHIRNDQDFKNLQG